MQSITASTLTAAVCLLALFAHPNRGCNADAAYQVYNINELNDEVRLAGYELNSEQARCNIRQVFFWTDIDFRGDKYTLHLTCGRCYRVSAQANNKFSSVNTNGECLDLFAGDDCSGASVRITPQSQCHRNLGECNLNDRVSSVRLCQERCNGNAYNNGNGYNDGDGYNGNGNNGNGGHHNHDEDGQSGNQNGN